MDVLLGRLPPPIDVGPGTLMEVAEQYHARASEIEMTILGWEADGTVARGEPAYRFRTGKLRTFTEAMRRTIDLGSRRVTMVQLEINESLNTRRVTP